MLGQDPLSIIVEIEHELTGAWLGEVPDLPGVLACRYTRPQAMSSVMALASRVLADRRGEVQPFPVTPIERAVPRPSRRATRPWRQIKASRMLAVLERTGWTIARATVVYKVLSRAGWPEIVWAFDAAQSLNPEARGRLRRHTRLEEDDLIRDVPIDRAALEEAFEDRNWETGKYLNIDTGEVAYLRSLGPNLGREMAMDPRYVCLDYLHSYMPTRYASPREIQEFIPRWLDAHALREMSRKGHKRLPKRPIADSAEIERLVTLAADALRPGGNRPVLDTFCGWTDVLLSRLSPSSPDRRPLECVRGAAEAFAVGRPDRIQLMLGDALGTPHNPSASDTMVELRTMFEGFRTVRPRGLVPRTPTQPATAELGHWVLDFVEETVTVAATTRAARSLLVALLEAAGSMAPAALAACQEIGNVRLGPLARYPAD
ncbi:MAG: hypothetical protein ABUS79_00225 [Pseudomonadota bacterium]